MGPGCCRRGEWCRAAWLDMGPNGANPPPFPALHIHCQGSRAMLMALWPRGDVLEHRVLRGDAVVATEACPLRGPLLICLPEVRSPMHVAVRQFLPSGIGVGLERIGEDDTMATQWQQVCWCCRWDGVRSALAGRCWVWNQKFVVLAQ